MNARKTTAPDPRDAKPLYTTRYAINVDEWESSTKVYEPTLDSLMDHVKSEVEAMGDGETKVITVLVKLMTDAEFDAMPEWGGP